MQKGFISPILMLSIVGVLFLAISLGYYLGKGGIDQPLGGELKDSREINSIDKDEPESTITSPAPLNNQPTVNKPEASKVKSEKILYNAMPTWQTYTDTEAKFLIQYPENFSIPISGKGKAVDFRIKDPESIFCIPGFEAGGCLSGYIVLINDYDGSSRREWFKKKNPGVISRHEIKEFEISGAGSLLIFNQEFGDPLGAVALIPRGNKMFVIYFYFSSEKGNGNDVIDDRLSHLKNILSTFKFL
ncbi:hypothetical protein HYT74_04020 [Candidatus Daviesbacteria bacterium]|nr:hypothetical protein [Candidatus Daviesbacteria bacterium]MBI4038823.1 hypothetical protein [Candidatus Daviesbacteria bacterium]